MTVCGQTLAVARKFMITRELLQGRWFAEQGFIIAGQSLAAAAFTLEHRQTETMRILPGA